jgi:hypothetical protein
MAKKKSPIPEAQSRQPLGEAQSRQTLGEAQSRQALGEAQSRQVLGEAQSRQPLGEAISASILISAQSLEEQGQVHQSLDLYLKLVERYPASREAPFAAEKLLAIAAGFRQAGQHHMALRVLERLEAAHQGA